MLEFRPKGLAARREGIIAGPCRVPKMLEILRG